MAEAACVGLGFWQHPPRLLLAEQDRPQDLLKGVRLAEKAEQT